MQGSFIQHIHSSGENMGHTKSDSEWTFITYRPGNLHTKLLWILRGIIPIADQTFERLRYARFAALSKLWAILSDKFSWNVVGYNYGVWNMNLIRLKFGGNYVWFVCLNWVSRSS